MSNSHVKGKGRGSAKKVQGVTREMWRDIGRHASAVAVFTDDPGPNGATSDPVEQLRKNAESLNQLTDAASGMIARLEEFLAAQCSVGIDAQVGYSAWEQPLTGVSGGEALAYRRVGQAFRIAVVEWHDGCPDDEDVIKPWAECARDRKIDSLAVLPDLIRQINIKLAERITRAKDSIYKVASMFTANQEPE